MQIKTTRYHYMPNRWGVGGVEDVADISNAFKDIKQLEVTCTVCGRVTWDSHLRKPAVISSSQTTVMSKILEQSYV